VMRDPRRGPFLTVDREPLTGSIDRYLGFGLVLKSDRTARRPSRTKKFCAVSKVSRASDGVLRASGRWFTIGLVSSE
jgi:hypothetical protein